MERKMRIVFLVVAPVLLLTIGVFVALSQRKAVTTTTTTNNEPVQETEASPTPEESQKPATDSAAPTLSAKQKQVLAKIETLTIVIENSSFDPADLTIKANDQVQWENKDTVDHQITGEGWGNVPVKEGEKFTQAFLQPGTYPYFCSIHPEMKGTITVE